MIKKTTIQTDDNWLRNWDLSEEDKESGENLKKRIKSFFSLGKSDSRLDKSSGDPD